MWAIANTTYMALLGPQGFAEVGEAIMARSDHAARRLAELPGVRLRHTRLLQGVRGRLQRTGKTVRQINKALLERGIFGGKDLLGELPEFGQSALYCVTEIHTREDIDRLVSSLQEVLAR